MTRAEILFIKSLADKRARTENGLFVAEGRKLVLEAVRSGFGVHGLYLSGGDSLPVPA